MLIEIASKKATDSSDGSVKNEQHDSNEGATSENDENIEQQIAVDEDNNSFDIYRFYLQDNVAAPGKFSKGTLRRTKMEYFKSPAQMEASASQ